MKSKLLTLLLSVSLALGLWFYVVTNVSPEHEQKFYGIPVVLENEKALMDKQLMLVSGEEYKVSFVLRGNRAELNRLSANDLKVTVDLSEIDQIGEYQLDYKVSYPSGVSGVTVENRITNKVEVLVAEYAEKEVPVQVVLNGEQPEGLFVDREGVTTSVTQVKISGPKDEVDQIEVAGIEVDASQLSETVSGEFVYTLMNGKGEPVEAANVTTDTGEIHMLLPVEYIKELPLSVQLIEGGGAKEENAKVQMEIDTLTISGSKEALEKINEMVLTTVNLAEVDLENGYETDAEIKLPENLTNHSGLDAVHVRVTLEGLKSKTVTLTRDQVRLLNVPAGMHASVSTVKLEVLLRGPAGKIDSFSSNQLLASIDFSEQSLGTYTLPVALEIRGAEDVGACGKYSATVTLSATESGNE